MCVHIPPPHTSRLLQDTTPPILPIITTIITTCATPTPPPLSQLALHHYQNMSLTPLPLSKHVLQLGYHHHHEDTHTSYYPLLSHHTTTIDTIQQQKLIPKAQTPLHHTLTRIASPSITTTIISYRSTKMYTSTTKSTGASSTTSKILSGNNYSNIVHDVILRLTWIT